MIDKEYIKQLSEKLCFELDDEQTEKIIQELRFLDEQLIKSPVRPSDLKLTPIDYPRVVNCAKFRKDKPEVKKDEDYLSNAKVADKYVVGK